MTSLSLMFYLGGSAFLGFIGQAIVRKFANNKTRTLWEEIASHLGSEGSAKRFYLIFAALAVIITIIDVMESGNASPEMGGVLVFLLLDWLNAKQSD